jgi:hypothetical protein
VSSEQEASIYRLRRVPGLGPSAVGRVLAAWREEPELVETFWGRPANEYHRLWSLPPRAARYLQGDARGEEDRVAAEADFAAARASAIEMLTLLDGSYATLAAVRDLPPVLFTRGNQDLLWDAGAAILHSRGAPEEALAWGAGLAFGLAEAGVGLCTGHNRDAYRRTAAAAKRAGAPLVIVLDRPLHGEPSAGPRAEPVVTARLWDAQFRPERELVISSMGPQEAWTPAHARRRDEMVIGLSDVVVAGAVRSGGIMADLCRRTAIAQRPIFRSPFCHADLAAELLPLDVDAAAGMVMRAAHEPGGTGSASRVKPGGPQPGWLERRWSQAETRFLAEMEELLGPGGWVERRPAGPVPADDDAASPGVRCAEIAAVVVLPMYGECRAGEMVVLGWRGQPDGGRRAAAPALLLSPREPMVDLQTLQAYLARCRARIEAAFRAPLPSAAPECDRDPIRDAPPSPE